MKKFFYLGTTCFFIVVCLLLFTSCTALSTVRKTTFMYKINSDGTECTISLKDKTVESIEIPATVTEDNIPVTDVGDFSEAKKLKNVVLPDSIKSIYPKAFKGCIALKSINIPDDVTIGEYAFSGCTALKEITLPKNLDALQKGVFYNCTSLESIEIPKEAWYISDLSFYGCISLSTVTFNTTGLELIGAGAFAKCSFENINIPSTVSLMLSGAFAENPNLKSVVIPNNVQKLKKQVFENCTALESVTIPSSVTRIESNAFYKCSSLTTCTYLGTTDAWNSIVKEDGWNTLSAITKVLCTDGDITI